MPLAALYSSGSLGRKSCPTAYSSGPGRRTSQSSRTTRAKKSCGMATRQPAPSPVLASQPQAPRCVMRTSISSASVTQLRVATLSRLPAA